MQKYNLIQRSRDPRLYARRNYQEKNISQHNKLMSKTQKIDPTFSFRVNVTTLTQHITSVHYFKNIIDPHSQYQIIPSVPQSLCWNIDELISAAVQVSKGKILDVTLPFRQIQIGKMSKYYFGRYIFSNGKLIGIRLASSKQENQFYPSSNLLKWQKKKLTQIDLWSELKQSYAKNNVIYNVYEKIPIGDFILKSNNATLGILFQSQINQNNYILGQYEKLGVTILSVLDDTPINPYSFQVKKINCFNYKAKGPNVFRLTEHRRQKVVIYSGVRMALLDFPYLALSCIASQKGLQNGLQSVWSDSYLVVTCNLPKNQAKIHKNAQNAELTKIYQSNFSLQLSRYNTPKETQKKFFNSTGVPEKLERNSNIDVLPIFRLIYIYKHINKFAKFVVPTTISISFFLQIQKLSKFLQKQISQLVTIYKPKGSQKLQVNNLINKMSIYDSLEELIEKQKMGQIYIYTNYQKQYVQLESLAKKQNNIFICSQYILPVMQNDTNRLTRLRQITNMDSFVNEILQSNLYDTKQMLKLARSQKYMLDINSQVNSITQRLKQRLKQCFVLTPFAHHFLSLAKQQIIKQLDQAELSLLLNKQGISQHRNQMNNLLPTLTSQDDFIMKEKMQKQSKAFTKKLKQAKKFRQKYKQLVHFSCHACKIEFQKSITYSCLTCRIKTCYPCMDDLLKLKGQKIQKDFNCCVSCLNLCRCLNCRKISKDELFQFIQMIQEEKQQKNNDKWSYKQSCSRCQLSGRKNMRISINCRYCNFSQCWSCAKSNQFGKLDDNYIYTCKKCCQNQSNVTNDQKKQNQIKISNQISTQSHQNQQKKRTQSKDTIYCNSIENKIPLQKRSTSKQNKKQIEKIQQQYYKPYQIQKSSKKRSRSSSSSPESLKNKSDRKKNISITFVKKKRTLRSSSQSSRSSSKFKPQKDKKIIKYKYQSSIQKKMKKRNDELDKSSFIRNDPASLWKPNKRIYKEQNKMRNEVEEKQQIKIKNNTLKSCILPVRRYDNNQDIEY